MSVYVDVLMSCIPTARWKWSRSCHLFADTTEELTRFGAGIGLRFEWLQVKRAELIHFDLNAAKRREAVKAGAIEVGRLFVVQYMKARARDIWTGKKSIL